MNESILAIDPGSKQSAVVMYNNETIVTSCISDNPAVFCNIENAVCDVVVIEMVACYGMPVGREIFDTVRYIGRFEQHAKMHGKRVDLVYRKDIKMHFCNSARAKDSNIRQALIDRFGEPGTKKAPGKTYGLKADMWAALAVAVYYSDIK